MSASLKISSLLTAQVHKYTVDPVYAEADLGSKRN